MSGYTVRHNFSFNVSFVMKWRGHIYYRDVRICIWKSPERAWQPAVCAVHTKLSTINKSISIRVRKSLHSSSIGEVLGTVNYTRLNGPFKGVSSNAMPLPPPRRRFFVRKLLLATNKAFSTCVCVHCIRAVIVCISFSKLRKNNRLNPTGGQQRAFILALHTEVNLMIVTRRSDSSFFIQELIYRSR